MHFDHTRLRFPLVRLFAVPLCCSYMQLLYLVFLSPNKHRMLCLSLALIACVEGPMLEVIVVS